MVITQLCFACRVISLSVIIFFFGHFEISLFDKLYHPCCLPDISILIIWLMFYSMFFLNALPAYLHIICHFLYFSCRCGEPAPEGVFSNFSLLLTEDPIEDSDDEINIGVSYGEDKHKSSTGGSTKEEEDDEKEIDPDDRFYFPTEEKEIDISKPIRDLVHLEITVNAVCDASCKGLCLRCGTNLNKMRCNCSKEEVQDGKYGPLKNLRKQMQQK